MRIITERVSPDEPCHGFQDIDRLVKNRNGSTTWHRFACVYVVRGDSIAAYSEDMGPTANFSGEPLLKILSMGDDTVGEVCEEALRSRGDRFERELRAEIQGTSTLIRDFIQEKEENWERINNRSQFGPKQVKQRNGYSKRAAYEHNRRN